VRKNISLTSIGAGNFRAALFLSWLFQLQLVFFHGDGHCNGILLVNLLQKLLVVAVALRRLLTGQLR